MYFAQTKEGSDLFYFSTLLPKPINKFILHLPPLLFPEWPKHLAKLHRLFSYRLLSSDKFIVHNFIIYFSAEYGQLTEFISFTCVRHERPKWQTGIYILGNWTAAVLTVSIWSRRRSGNAFSGMLFCPISIVVLTFHGLPAFGGFDVLASGS